MEITGKKSLILIITATIVLFFLSYLIGHTIFQNKSYNFMVKMTAANNIPSDDIILVVIDNKSIHQIGRWPWKREKMIEVFDYLEYHTNAKVITYDAVIMSPDMENLESDRKFFNGIKGYNKLIAGVGFENKPFDNYINEKEYNEILQTKNNVTIIDKRSEKNKAAVYYKSFTPFIETYFKNIKLLGAVNTFQDTDGYIRRIDQMVSYNGKLYPSLGLLTYAKYTGINKFILTDNFIEGKNENYRLKIPIKNDMGLIYNYIYFYGTTDDMYSHKVVSASDIIISMQNIRKGKKPVIDSSIFDGKAVFVGANANAEALSDVKRTPISDTFAGVDIQATNFNNMIDNKFFIAASPLYDFCSVLLVFFLGMLIVGLLPISTALLCISCSMFLFLIFAFFMYEHRIAIGLILPEIFMIFAIGCGYYLKYIFEGRKKEKIQSAMSKYISKDVMNSVVKNIDSIKLGGKRAEVTVLFADIRGFTSISERLSAVEVTKILNEYFSELVPLIEQHNGILNKFMGDAVLAIFGEPIKNENHPVDAVRCADKMLKKVKALQERWISEGKPKIEIGVGIATGEVFIGNIGSESRLEYTVIGDTVNTASRIENYNKVYRTNFLISEETYLRVQKYVDVIKIREVSIRGKAKKINIYEVLRILDV